MTIVLFAYLEATVTCLVKKKSQVNVKKDIFVKREQNLRSQQATADTVDRVLLDTNAWQDHQNLKSARQEHINQTTIQMSVWNANQAMIVI